MEWNESREKDKVSRYGLKIERNVLDISRRIAKEIWDQKTNSQLK